jgi:hypothetical protein
MIAYSENVSLYWYAAARCFFNGSQKFHAKIICNFLAVSSGAQMMS